MHLLQSGVDITVIALWLGHEDVQTTHVYPQANLAMKEKALNKLVPPETKVARFKPCDELLAFLVSLMFSIMSDRKCQNPLLNIICRTDPT
jgi:integrase/recombinase XerD